MTSSKLLLTFSLLIAQTAFGATVEKKLFTMEKNYNPENILVIHAQTNESCKFESKDNQYIDYHWMMNRTVRKEVHPMIRKQIDEKVQFSGINNLHDSFKVRMNDLNELKHDLESLTLEVSSSIVGGNCVVKSILKLGPSAKYRKLNLKRTYCEVTTNFIGVPNGCKFIELEGTDADTNEKLKVRFMSK